MTAAAPVARPSLPWTWGASEAERTAPRACDGLVRAADAALVRAVDVTAPPAAVFRWLCQLRVAPYSYDWLDNWDGLRLRRSPRRLVPGLEAPAPGQRFMRIFELVALVPGRELTLRMTSPDAVRRFGEVAVTYAAEPASAGSTRLVARLVVRFPRRGLARTTRWLLPWSDLVMMRKQLLTLRRLAEDVRSG